MKKFIFASLLIVCSIGILFAQSRADRRPTPLELDQLVGVTRPVVQFEYQNVLLLPAATVLTNIAGSNSVVICRNGGATTVSCRLPCATNSNVGKVYTFRNSSTTNLMFITNVYSQYVLTASTGTGLYHRLGSNDCVRVINTGSNWWVLDKGNE